MWLKDLCMKAPFLSKKLPSILLPNSNCNKKTIENNHAMIEEDDSLPAVKLS